MSLRLCGLQVLRVAAAIARKHRGDLFVGGDAALPGILQSLSHGFALFVAQPIDAEVLGLKVDHEAHEFGLRLVRPGRGAFHQGFKGLRVGHNYKYITAAASDNAAAACECGASSGLASAFS